MNENKVFIMDGAKQQVIASWAMPRLPNGLINDMAPATLDAADASVFKRQFAKWLRDVQRALS
jgi:hypothetical protein